MTSKKPILIDTDIFIDMLSGLPQAMRFFSAVQDNTYDAFVSAITVAELHQGSSAAQPKVAAAINQLLNLCSVIPIDREIAKIASTYVRQYKKQLPDMLNAACTTSLRNCVLITRNRKDFQDIPALKTQAPYE